jgi:hypothetical protein
LTHMSSPIRLSSHLLPFVLARGWVSHGCDMGFQRLSLQLTDSAGYSRMQYARPQAICL